MANTKRKSQITTAKETQPVVQPVEEPVVTQQPLLTPEEYKRKMEVIIKRLDEGMALSTESYKLSSQEFDKQIVYIAGGGLALTIGFFKDIIAITPKEYLPLLFWSWVSFGITLFLNLFSHKKATESYDSSMSLHRHYRDSFENDQDADKDTVKEHDDQMNAAGKWVKRLNQICLYAIGIGIALLISFAYKAFYNMPQEQKPEQPQQGQQLNKAQEPDLIKGMPPPAAIRAMPQRPAAPNVAPTPNTDNGATTSKQ
ncbi:hypothetical protein [Hymenobacter sp. AT01-02]|uniref:hypothetical protein n=1 Tax=Hymenobacter sp. AT01-02 TaxID=1571877 RepID=UPI0005F0D60E|nr:hypothetical protein [Hymenobacter sp. AT01-02]